MENKSKNYHFLLKRLKSFYFAFKGIYYLIKTQPNAWIHLIISSLVVFFGFYCQISWIEWCLILLAFGLVWSAEAFNTAMETVVDWLSAEYHPKAEIIKDVAAGAVLITAIMTALIGMIIFVPKLLF
jgi:diacylglycerol kinase